MEKGTIVEIVGEQYRVAIGGNVSAPLPRLQLSRLKENEYNLAVGDTVLVNFFSQGLFDGIIVGRFTP